jgi:hypothetical protein
MSVNISDNLRIRYSNQYDRCIMDPEAMQRYTPGQQRDINLVRLYIQALTLSDLSTSNGTAIREHFLCGHRRDDQKVQETLAATEYSNQLPTTTVAYY